MKHDVRCEQQISGREGLSDATQIASAVGFLFLFVCLGSGERKSKLKHGLVIESNKR